MLIREAFPSDTAAIAQVHVDSWRTTYAGIVPADYLANLSYAQREQFWCDILSTPTPSRCVYVAAQDTGETVGFASGGPRAQWQCSLSRRTVRHLSACPLSPPGSRTPSNHGGDPTAA